MKVRIKAPFIGRRDAKLYKKNDIVEVDEKDFMPVLMEKLPEEPKPKKKTSKKG